MGFPDSQLGDTVRPTVSSLGFNHSNHSVVITCFLFSGGVSYITTLKVPEAGRWKVDRRGGIAFITTLGSDRQPQL